jgi:hypothetical protein
MRMNEDSLGRDQTQYMSSWTVWEGNTQYRYIKYIDHRGQVRTDKRFVQKKAAVKTTTRPAVSSRTVVKSTPVKSTPAPVPKPPAPTTVAKPSFSIAKPVPPTAFSYTVAEPVKREVLIPQPPPSPGPKPAFQFKKQTSVTKYEYLYGIKHLELNHTQYDNKSVYVSKPINVAGNVMQVSLDAIEEHPLFDELNGQAGDRQTSVEYYVASVGTNPSPTLDDWYAILPEDTKTVKSELLIFETARTANLRFPALIGSKEKPVIYKNGIRMNEDQWSFAAGGYKVNLLIERDPVAIYTIDYTPNAEFYNPWTIDINQRLSTPVRHTQVFEKGTNHNKTVVLEKYPYTNYETINTTNGYEPNTSSYVPVKVTLQDAGIAGPSRMTHKQVFPYDGSDQQLVFTKNITNYKTGHSPEFKRYSIDPETSYNGFEYYQVGDKLYFSETFNNANIFNTDFNNADESHGNAKIQVDYEYLSSDFRMKIILRRNSTDENTLTPVVHEYTLKFKVMK